jgi:hypothetical protein
MIGDDDEEKRRGWPLWLMWKKLSLAIEDDGPVCEDHLRWRN